jgi:hypothetical protein
MVTSIVGSGAAESTRTRACATAGVTIPGSGLDDAVQKSLGLIGSAPASECRGVAVG